MHSMYACSTCDVLLESEKEWGIKRASSLSNDGGADRDAVAIHFARNAQFIIINCNVVIT